MDIAAAEKTNGRADGGHVGCQGIGMAHLEIHQLAEVVHEGEVSSRGVRVVQNGHHFKPLFEKAEAHVKTGRSVTRESREDGRAELTTRGAVGVPGDQGSASGAEGGYFHIRGRGAVEVNPLGRLAGESNQLEAVRRRWIFDGNGGFLFLADCSGNSVIKVREMGQRLKRCSVSGRHEGWFSGTIRTPRQISSIVGRMGRGRGRGRKLGSASVRHGWQGGPPMLLRKIESTSVHCGGQGTTR